MSGLQTGIELNDQFSNVVYTIINSVNLAVSAMYDMQESMNADIDTRSLESARNEINQATAALDAMNEALSRHVSPEIQPDMPDTPNTPFEPITLPEPAAPNTPVEIPVVWNTDGLEVFTGTGVERFEQEVQSANNMLEQLSSTQDAIARQAYDTNLLPPEAFRNLNMLAVRMDIIRERIQQIENNPVNIGTDTANAELEQLRAQLNIAVEQQNELNSAMQNMDVSAANDAYLRLSQTVGSTERYIRDNVDEQGRFNREIQEGTQQADELTNMIKNAVMAYATVQTAGSIIDLSDTMTQTTARLGLIVDDGGSVEELQNKIFASAQNARGSYMATADAVSKLGTQASQAFTSNDELIVFTELLNKSFVNAGTSAQGIDSVMLQLTQSMAAGKLQGEELNAVLDNAAPIVQNIQQYLEEVQGIDAGNIKELASEGVITADIVKNAMFYAADDINAKFESMPMTWGQVWQSMQNTALIAFQPVLQRLNDIANTESFQVLVGGAIEAIATLANIVLNIFDLVAAAGSLTADNWSIVGPVVYGVAAALAVYYGWQLAVNTVNLIGNGIHVAMAAAQMMHAAATGGLTAATAADIAAQNGLNAAMYACPIVWIIALIVALIAIFYAAVAAVNKFAGTSVSATGLISGAFATLGAFVINTVIISLWNMLVSFINFLGNSFINPIANIKILFYDMCLTVIGYIQNLASAIETLLNKIPGVTVDITSGLDSFYSGLEEAQQAVKDESGWIEYVHKMEYIDYTDTARTGYNLGAQAEEAVSSFNLSDLFGKTDIPNPEDYISGFEDVIANSGIGDNLGNIAGDTGAISDSMDITQEELKYLRDIAEQETINRFTTAEITIQQTNNNTIKNGMDLDGVMSNMTDMVNEAIDISTEGVHE